MHVDARVIVATNRNLEQMVDAQEFREDLLWRISGKKLLLPPLRDRKGDVEILAKHFISQDPIRKKEISSDAMKKMNDYTWPGNVRELKRVCEYLIVNSPLPIIRAEDLKLSESASTQQSAVVGQVDYAKGLGELVKDFEKHVIESCLDEHKDVDNVSQLLKVSRSNLYKKIKDYQIDWRD